MGTQKKAKDLGNHPLFGWAKKKDKEKKKKDEMKKKGTPKKKDK